MNMMCKSSNTANDVRCAVCGQGFLVYWADHSPAERVRQYASVLEVLRKHHVAMETERIHPAGEFHLSADVAPQNHEVFSGHALKASVAA
jgi:predicted DNA-binding protein with PD1-like motif